MEVRENWDKVKGGLRRSITYIRGSNRWGKWDKVKGGVMQLTL